MPRVIGFWKIFCCRPRVCKVFFFVALRWAPRPFGGARAKKKTPPRAFVFFCSGPGERQGKEKPRAGTGPEQKKTPPRVCFFLLRPRGVFFFALAPCRRPTGLLLPLPFPGAGAKKKTPWVVLFFALAWVVFFFALAPPKGRGAQRSATKKKTHFAHPGPTAKNFLETNDAGRADAHSLTAGLGGDASPSPGWCFFFLLRPCPDRWCFFCCGPARTLTHSLWAGAISARPGWCFFFCCGPAGSF